MIDFLNGALAEKNMNFLVVEVNGIGYRVAVAVSTYDKVSGLALGAKLKLFVHEAVAGMYGGVIMLYGFLSIQEREMFLLIKDEVPSTGAKKAMEYFDKISKSLPDFKRAVMSKDIEMLSGIFGFTKKTAEKLAAALKDKISALEIEGNAKWAQTPPPQGAQSEAIAGLVAMGFKEAAAREAVSEVSFEKEGHDARHGLSPAEIIKKALQHL
ncbi:MAG: Holliday junction branch migration protein RuvA [Elusimicrobia bacterium]|nr:Holliday junction branch migration protein RuvA [Elusimicrobiota bacterium]